MVTEFTAGVWSDTPRWPWAEASLDTDGIWGALGSGVPRKALKELGCCGLWGSREDYRQAPCPCHKFPHSSSL